jgi:N,N'-diacetyllegionaminate synthase
LLHCVSNYPCADVSINLNVLNTLKTAFNTQIGYSDHSSDVTAAILATTFGIRYLEKHFTLDKNMDGPDHKASSNPAEFMNLVTNVRRVNTILGNSAKILQDEEKSMKTTSRKSIHSKVPLKKSDVIQKSDLIFLRPGHGISPLNLEQVIGKKLNRSLSENEIILQSYIT